MKNLFLLFFLFPFIAFCSQNLVIKFYISDDYDIFLSSYEDYYSLLSKQSHTKISIVFDSEKHDKEKVVQDFNIQDNTKISFAKYFSYIDGVNDLSFIEEDYDMILFANPHFSPTYEDYDLRMISLMKEKFPKLNGILHFKSDAIDEINALPIVGKNYLKNNKTLYSNEYTSYFYDFEMTLISQLKKLSHFEELQLFSYFPKFQRPELKWKFTDIRYAPFDRTLSKDFDTLISRFCTGFDSQLKEKDQPLTLSTSYLFKPSGALKWSILIPTVPSRKDVFYRLMSSLIYQMLITGTTSDIELVFCLDNCEMVLGDKRNHLLTRAKGEYLNFIDDDDEVSLDYISGIYKLLEKNPDYVEILLLKENTPLKFNKSYIGKSQKRYFKNLSFNIAFFSHLNPVKRSIALKAAFPSINYAEDLAWARLVLETELLKTGEFFDKPCYFYHFNPTTSLTFPKNQK